MIRPTAAFLAASALVPAALAHDGDVGIRNDGGRLGTVLVSGEPPSQVFGTDPERVFAAELQFSILDSIVTAEAPGYASNDASILGRSIRPNILSALRVWNGSAFVTTATTMSTGKPPAFPLVSTPATDVLTPTSPFTVTDDFHFDWLLNGATASSGDGVYLVELNLVDLSPTNPLLPSQPYWIVFNYDRTEAEHEAAIQFVENNLVPAPGAGGLVAGLGLLATRRRRR